MTAKGNFPCLLLFVNKVEEESQVKSLTIYMVMASTSIASHF